MTVIMSETSGGRTRTCSGSCHKAKKPKCRCICGGRYHGAGDSEKAQEKLQKDLMGVVDSPTARAMIVEWQQPFEAVKVRAL